MAKSVRLAVLVLAQACTPFGTGAVSNGDAGASPATDAGANADASVDASSITDGPIPAATESCKGILLADPSRATRNGKYTITPPKGAGPVEVWCDMTTDGGGYTLVGRSVDGADPDTQFGWRRGSGSIDDTSKPYSLNLEKNPVAFTAVLLGDYSSGMTWGANVFKVIVPPDFVMAHDQSTTPLARPSAMVVGTCAPREGRGWMFNYAGYTANTDDLFWFRDQAGYSGNGLGNAGWLLADACCNGDACDRSAELQNKQGMVMVR